VDYERALVGTAIFFESEMALFSECMWQCARKLLDTAKSPSFKATSTNVIVVAKPKVKYGQAGHTK
jgi:hypothetical protein